MPGRRLIRIAAVGVVAVVIAALLASGGDDAGIGRIPVAFRTRALLDLAAHATPGGPVQPLLGERLPIERGQDLAILGDPVEVDGTPWFRVYVMPLSTGRSPDDFFTWIPAKESGQDAVSPPVGATCPPTRDNLSTLAALDPFSRARCQGAATFSIEGRTWDAVLPVWYDTKPNWLGPWRGSGPYSVSLHNDGLVDVRLPPGLERPPLDITIRADLHVADAASAACQRRDSTQGLPVESAEESRLWCAVQIVMERWDPLLGSEDRPFDASSPQLHRSEPSNICAGVGTGLLTFRTDPSRLDPVWLEATPGGQPILAWFGPEFRTAFEPDLVVVDAAGQVVARNDLTVDPDRLLAGHFLCMTISGLYIN
jgi:hypothetical protein